MPQFERSFRLHQFSLQVASNDCAILKLISNQLNLFPSKSSQKPPLIIRLFLNKVKWQEIPRTNPDIFSLYPLFMEGRVKERQAFFNAGLRTINCTIDFKKNIINTYFSQEEYFDKNLLFDLVFFQSFKLLLRYYKFYTIHAACLAKGNEAILLPGEAGCGKTVITLSLIRKGYKYLSDDDVILRQNHRRIECLSLPTNPKIKVGSIKLFPEIKKSLLKDEPCFSKKTIDIQRLYPECFQDKANVKLIIFPRYSSASKIKLKPMPKQEAFSRLAKTDFRGIYGDRKKTHRYEFNLLSSLLKQTKAFELFYQDKYIKAIPEIISSLF